MADKSGIMLLGVFDRNGELIFIKSYAEKMHSIRLTMLVQLCRDLFKENLEASSSRMGHLHGLIQSIGDLYGYGVLTATGTFLLAIVKCESHLSMKEAVMMNVSKNFFLSVIDLNYK